MKNNASVIVFLILILLVLGRSFQPQPQVTEFPVERFGELPVLEGGRFKPIDSLARTSLLLLSGRQTAELESGEKITAKEWLMQVVLWPEMASNYKVFRVDQSEVKRLLGSNNPVEKRFSFSQIMPHIEQIEARVEKIPEESALQDATQKDLLKLYRNLSLYRKLTYSFRLPLMQETVSAEYQRYLGTLKQAAEILQEDSSVDPNDPVLARVTRYAQSFGRISEFSSPKFVPREDEDWLNLGESLIKAITEGSIPETTIRFGELSDAYIRGDIEGFEKVLDQLESIYREFGEDYSRDGVHYETLMNTMQPFTISMSFYVLVFISVFFAWLLDDRRLLGAIFWAILVTFLIHSLGMIARMVIQGRPPVTNLYSASVFVGWGSVLLGVILEKIYKNGLGAAVASVVGFVSLLVANHLMAAGDTLEMMRAVLDSNFWLATHVVIVTMGYSATYLAGVIGAFYFGIGIFSKMLDRKLERTFVRMVYGIVCFGLLFSFVGTVLGAVWADQSWGRFWGWDPKENGALMIVLWTALILHAHRIKMVRTVGLMNLAIFGSVITIWSHYGTNMLGVGLHSYGFVGQQFFWVSISCLIHVGIMIFGGYFPRKYWRSKP